MTDRAESRPTDQDRDLLREARGLVQRSVGPAALCAGAVAVTVAGEKYPGATFHFERAGGLSVCAEQVAMSAARASSSSPIATVALWIPATARHHPCGPCRQIWLELAPRASFLLQRGEEDPLLLSLDRLLPDAFASFEPPRGEAER